MGVRRSSGGGVEEGTWYGHGVQVLTLVQRASVWNPGSESGTQQRP